MKTIGSKKNTGTVGLEWTVLDSKLPESKAVRAQLADENNAGVKYGLVFKFRGGAMPITMLGTVPPGESKPAHPSAAAWVALAHQAELAARRKTSAASRKKSGKKKTDAAESSEPANTLSADTAEGEQVWLVIEKLNDDAYWFLVVREGVPMPTTDIVISYGVTIQLMGEALNNQVVLFSNDQDIRDQAQGLAYRIEDKGFAQITEKVRPGRAQIRALSGIPASIILSLVLVVLGIGLWWGYSAWQGHQQKLLAQQRAQQAASEQAAKLQKDQAAYDAEVRKAVLAALKSGMDKVNATLVSPSAPDVIDGWVDLVENTSINHSGWDVSGFECAYTDGRPQCVVSLARGPYGINRLLLEDHPDAVLEGDKATYTIQAPAQPARQTVVRDLPQASDFTADFISELQFLRLARITYNLAESKEMTEPVKMPPQPTSMFKPGTTPPVAAAPVQLGVASGDLTLSGATLWQLRGLRQLLGGSNLAAQTTSLTATRASTGGWTLKVIYAIRMRPAPVLPTVLDSKGQPMTVELPAEYRAAPEDLAKPSGGNVPSSESSALPVEPAAGEVPAGQPLPDELPAPPPASQLPTPDLPSPPAPTLPAPPPSTAELPPIGA